MALAVKLECPLRDFVSLRSLVVSDSTWKAEFIQQEALAMYGTESSLGCKHVI